MADIIQLLPDSVANQIAAGEVIQRPASVVKELLENSVDAGSTSIDLIIKDAGKTLIQVVDNGCGMSETDARMSLERHATSKIKKTEDLFAIKTMGFRGEALASIAAVAQLEVKTKPVDEEVGVRLEVEGSEVKNQEPCACSDGTSIAVKNLFFNVPARRNFLKTNKVEARHVIEEFQRVALANPKIRFTLKHNNIELFHLPKSNLKQRIVGLFGKKYKERVVPVQEETDLLAIKGFVGKPKYAKKTRGEQFFFVNGRYIKSNYLNHSVMKPYDELLPDDQYPFYALFIDVDTKFIDVNIHPTKQEIKFEDQRTVYAIVQAAVKRALAQYSVSPSLDFDREAGFERAIQQDPSHHPAGSSSSKVSRFKQDQLRGASKQWRKLYEETLHSTPGESGSDKEEKGRKGQRAIVERSGTFDEGKKKDTQPYQVHQRFIVTHIKSGIMIIDQQAAHERILYDRYKKALEKKKVVSQQQLFPQTVEFSASDYALVEEILPEIKTLGFDIEPFGQHSFVIHSMPSDVIVDDEQKVFEQLVEQYKNQVSNLKLEKREGLALTMARFSSTKHGKVLGTQEMERLIDELFACESPYLSPSGKPTLITLTLDDLNEQFEQRK